MGKIKEFHLFAGIGGGIYGGELLGDECCAGVEIMPYAQRVLRQRQADGWMPKFPIYSDLCALHGQQFRGTFDVLCGGFPCQAFSSAAHGKNIAAKNLWGEMFRFVQESEAPIVFGENVVLKAIEKARDDLEGVGYRVERIRLSNADLGADHQRYRFWLLAVKDNVAFERVAKHLSQRPKLSGRCWEKRPEEVGEWYASVESERTDQLLGIGNAQSPFVAATAFRILVNRHLNHVDGRKAIVSEEELQSVFTRRETWICKTFGKDFGLLHTPTTVANYCCKSMQKHQGCRNYVKVFCENRGDTLEGRMRPRPIDAEYLMGFPLGASRLHPMNMTNMTIWKGTK